LKDIAHGGYTFCEDLADLVDALAGSVKSILALRPRRIAHVALEAALKVAGTTLKDGEKS